MREKITVLALNALLFALSLPVSAQQPGKVPRIAFLLAASPGPDPRVEGFRQGLRELGYVEGKNIAIEWRYAEGKEELVPKLAAELVQLNVEIIVTDGTNVTRAAKNATKTIPIVMASDADPVGNGFVASLARPGGNVTGLSTHYPEISGKQLELLKEVMPKLARAAVIGNTTDPANAQALRETERAAGALAVKLKYVEIRGPKDIQTAFQEALKGRFEAVLVQTNPILNSQETQVANLATKSRQPAVGRPRFVEAGGLIGYGVSGRDLYRRAATYVDKILKGTKPAELPVEQPTKFELVINLKTAKQIGLTIPQSVLYRADKVIK